MSKEDSEIELRLTTNPCHKISPHIPELVRRLATMLAHRMVAVAKPVALMDMCLALDGVGYTGGRVDSFLTFTSVRGTIDKSDAH